jgi:dCMP deaminase
MEHDGMTLPDVIHAERNAIMKCSTWDLWGSIMVVTHSPCVSCARMMRDAGVRSVYYLENYRDPAGIEVLRAAGIRVQRVLT